MMKIKMGNYTINQQRKYMDKYNKSPRGVLKKLYHHMKERSNKKGWIFYLTFEGFEEWAYKNNFEKVFLKWYLSSFDKKLKPSIDRINEFGFYELSNMQIITWEQNHIKMRTEKKNVLAYTKTFSNYRNSLTYPVGVIKGDFHFIFKNINEIKECFPFMIKNKISSCCNKKRKSHQGFNFYNVKKEIKVI